MAAPPWPASEPLAEFPTKRLWRITTSPSDTSSAPPKPPVESLPVIVTSSSVRPPPDFTGGWSLMAPPSSSPLPLCASAIVRPLIVTGSGPSTLKTCVSPFPLIVVEAAPAPTMLTPPRTGMPCSAST
jgi:hypothetical protein